MVNVPEPALTWTLALRVVNSHSTGTGAAVVTSSNNSGMVSAGTSPTDSSAGWPPPPVPMASVTALLVVG